MEFYIVQGNSNQSIYINKSKRNELGENVLHWENKGNLVKKIFTNYGLYEK